MNKLELKFIRREATEEQMALVDLMHSGRKVQILGCDYFVVSQSIHDDGCGVANLERYEFTLIKA
ncbi:MAG: hypothetical protein CMN85_10625 [Spongiibacteraceae bacterium]|nr:hypothetical protein [Spongiibacteraceae bacterium]|tara:strand:+ start:20636 stop:20830 length:195 start_codon:yes stop_codon:yes gene_type:complete